MNCLFPKNSRCGFFFHINNQYVLWAKRQFFIYLCHKTSLNHSCEWNTDLNRVNWLPTPLCLSEQCLENILLWVFAIMGTHPINFNSDTDFKNFHHYMTSWYKCDWWAHKSRSCVVCPPCAQSNLGMHKAPRRRYLQGSHLELLLEGELEKWKLHGLGINLPSLIPALLSLCLLIYRVIITILLWVLQKSHK